jgi:hypothetical protein
LGILRRKQSLAETTAKSAAPVILAERAIAYLQQASQVEPDDLDLLVEERVTWQPDSWLLQRIWQALADGGAGEAALTVAQMVEPRAPQARAQALYRLAQQTTARPALVNLVRYELMRTQPTLFGEWQAGEEWRQIERLLLYGASAAIIGEDSLALACIERADQFERVWDRVILQPELRSHVAQIVARVGLHPLTGQLISLAIRRYEDSGAQFVHQVASLIGQRVPREQLPRRLARLLKRCVDTFEFATLTSLAGRRLASAVFGQAGLVHELLGQITTISNVQDARRDSGLSGGKGDPHFLRQVKRPTANPDIDFQVYTLQEAIQAMPVRSIPREQRIALADRLAALAIRSDGWTAAGAAASLMELGAFKYAVSIGDHIPPHDPTRSEGVIALVRALLEVNEPQLADEQVRKALVWVKSLDKRNPERATIWGLVEVYLEHEMPEPALRLLEQRYAPLTVGERMRKVFQNRPNDDELRDNRLRFQVLLQQGAAWDKELTALYNQLRQWAPRLLDGEMLMSFYLDGLLRPLLTAGRTDLVWELLPQVREALSASSGDKHTVQVQRVTTLLANQAAPAIIATNMAAASVAATVDENAAANNGNHSDPDDNPDDLFQAPLQARNALTQFLVQLWESDVKKGLWQTIHGIEGSLSLLLTLEGPDALLTIAQMTLREGSQWVKPWQPKEKDAVPRGVAVG